jgi:hypothetical protein
VLFVLHGMAMLVIGYIVGCVTEEYRQRRDREENDD